MCVFELDMDCLLHCEDHSVCGLSRWEEALSCNAFSYWPSPYPKMPPASMSMVTAHLPGRHAKGVPQITWETQLSRPPLFSGPVWHVMHTEWLMLNEGQGSGNTQGNFNRFDRWSCFGFTNMTQHQPDRQPQRRELLRVKIHMDIGRFSTFC